MTSEVIGAAMGRRPFDLALRGGMLINVMTGDLYPADVGIVDGVFAYAAPFQACHSAAETIDADGLYLSPGFVDSHMHIESSMMTPAAFAEAVLPCGTTTVAADPHEIGNVLGIRGAQMLCDLSRNLPLKVHVMAPSTIPAAPGYETSGAAMDGAQVTELLRYPGVLGLGEVMDFLGVIATDPTMMDVIDAAKQAGVLLDGHVPTLRGKELQAFAASGIDCDHTYMDPELVMEKLRLGMCVQIQERFFTKELMSFLNECPVQSRITIVTDDVPISRLAAHGHLSALVRKAIALGLQPSKAYRYATINPADRLRLYDRGAIVPGRRADLVLLSSITEVRIEQVLADGKPVARGGSMLSPLPVQQFPEEAYHTMKISPLSPADFVIPCDGTGAVVNAIKQDGKTSRTKRVQRECRAENGVLQQGELVKMAVFERYTGRAGRSIGLLANLDEFRGAMATTYAHDCHNLTVYSKNDDDAVLAANTVIGLGGGVAAVLDGAVLCAIPLPIAGILCEDKMEALAAKFSAMNEAAKTMSLNHDEVLTFLTLMALSVSPEIKLTDRGVLDVAEKRFLPLVERAF